jgi:hypothetical protein
MLKIDQYLIYVEFYTKIIKTTSLWIPPLLRSTTLFQPPVHLYSSGKAVSFTSSAEILFPIVFQCVWAENLDIARDDHCRPQLSE